MSYLQKLKDTNKNGGWRKRATVSESEATAATGSHSGNLIYDAVEAALKAQQEKLGIYSISIIISLCCNQ